VSEARDLPRRVLIVGDGQVAIIAAIALRRALPASEVLVVGTQPDPEAMADRAPSSLPYTNRLHDELGIEEDDLVRSAGASHRLVTRFEGWSGGSLQGAASYGAALDPALKTAFAREWGGGPRSSTDAAQASSVGEALSAAGRFARPDGSPGSALADLDYALRWNGPAYRDYLIGVANRLGVSYRQGAISGVAPDGQGGAAAIAFTGAGEIAADIILDCTGPRAAVLSQLPEARRRDWSDRLPIRGLIHAPRHEATLGLADTVTLTDAGWLCDSPMRDGQARLLAVPEGVSEEAIVATLGEVPANAFRLAPGRAELAWCGNVIALGDAAATFEPLGWLNLDLAHRHLSLLLELLPGRTPDPRERTEYNRRSAMMADRACDFVASHYFAPGASVLADRIRPSAELELALDQFRRRGRMPFFEELPMLGQEWAGFLLAAGIAPGASPLAEASDAGAGEVARRAHEMKCVAAVAAAMPYDRWLAMTIEPA
jgi:tryptophan halogenase